MKFLRDFIIYWITISTPVTLVAFLWLYPNNKFDHGLLFLYFLMIILNGLIALHIASLKLSKRNIKKIEEGYKSVCEQNGLNQDTINQDAIKEWVLGQVEGITFNNYGDLAFPFDEEDEFSDFGFGIEEIVDVILAAEKHFAIEISDSYILQIKTIKDFAQLIYFIKYVE